MDEVLRGAVAGLAGTAVMSAAMAVAKATGLMDGEWPPRKVAPQNSQNEACRMANDPSNPVSTPQPVPMMKAVRRP